MPISIQLPAELEARLDALANASGKSQAYYVTEAVKRQLEDLEDLFVAEREVEAIRSGKSQLMPLEEVMKSYGMDA